jgi:hypothetical protein
MTSAIIKRLAKARENAGLSQTQVDRIRNLPVGTTKQMENEEIELTLRGFLLLCETYGVSQVWALTGVNPYVDVKELQLALGRTTIARDDMESLIELITTFPTEQEVQPSTGER